MSSDGEDYEHWADDDKYSIASAARSAGYDRYNGLHKWDYRPTDQDQAKPNSDPPKPKSEPPKPASVTKVSTPSAPVRPTPPVPPQQAVFYTFGGYQPPQYAYPSQMPMAYPALACYGYPTQGYAYGGPPGAWLCQTAPTPKEENPQSEKIVKPKTMKWQGRTRAEVEEDNMKIAMREGVCDARKVEPKGLKDDQMVWCVELDGTHTLRTFATLKDFHGDWKADPRFKDSWYFLRQEKK